MEQLKARLFLTVFPPSSRKPGHLPCSAEKAARQPAGSRTQNSARLCPAAHRTPYGIPSISRSTGRVPQMGEIRAIPGETAAQRFPESPRHSGTYRRDKGIISSCPCPFSHSFFPFGIPGESFHPRTFFPLFQPAPGAFQWRQSAPPTP